MNSQSWAGWMPNPYSPQEFLEMSTNSLADLTNRREVQGVYLEGMSRRRKRRSTPNKSPRG
ncbi:MAG: hypothetical protein U7126_17105 [Microcoleus sp.]